MILRCVSLSLVCALAGCSSSSSGTEPVRQCDDVLQSAIALHVRDSQTGRPAAKGASLVATYYAGAGPLVDTVKVATPDSLTMFAGSAAGRYDLQLSEPGYAPWFMTSVVVAQDLPGCGPKLLDLNASIQPAP